jgi:hypothetical protein
MKESTIKRAFEELFKTIDIINVVKTCQEIRLLKEIIFEPYQKRLFENLIHPIVTTDEVKCAYDIEHLEIKAKNEKEKDAMSKANLKDSLIQLSSCESYSEIDNKLTLGDMSYLLKPNLRVKNGLRLKLGEYLDNLPEVDLSKWNIKYLSQIKAQKKIVWFSNIKKMLLNPILSWTDTLKLMKVYQQQYLKDCHYVEFQAGLTSRIVIIANIFNSIHHFLDYIDELIYQNILDEQLFLQSKDDCIIFHQNICQSIEELAQVYPLQLILMMKNPNQVFLLQDEYFVYDVWSNNLTLSFTNSIFKKSPESFRQFTMHFFNHLPRQVLIDVNVNHSAIDYY